MPHQTADVVLTDGMHRIELGQFRCKDRSGPQILKRARRRACVINRLTLPQWRLHIDYGEGRHETIYLVEGFAANTGGRVLAGDGEDGIAQSGAVPDV